MEFFQDYDEVESCEPIGGIVDKTKEVVKKVTGKKGKSSKKGRK